MCSGSIGTAYAFKTTKTQKLGSKKLAQNLKGIDYIPPRHQANAIVNLK
jgi:hypothetical protein